MCDAASPDTSAEVRSEASFTVADPVQRQVHCWQRWSCRHRRPAGWQKHRIKLHRCLLWECMPCLVDVLVLMFSNNKTSRLGVLITGFQPVQEPSAATEAPAAALPSAAAQSQAPTQSQAATPSQAAPSPAGASWGATQWHS